MEFSWVEVTEFTRGLEEWHKGKDINIKKKKYVREASKGK